MVLGPNFVLGIKQTSLHNKQDSHMCNIDPQQCPHLFSDLGPQHHVAPTETPSLLGLWSLKQAMPLTFQICAH